VADDDTPLPFPHSRVTPARRPTKQLGLGAIARALEIPEARCNGHWCSRCQGIWFGYLLEVECPVCANRHG
jgi:hypothetical protein